VSAFDPALLDEIRARFAHVDNCPFQGPRTFFENAGGALTQRSVVETSARLAAIPDNQGRDTPAAAALMQVIADAKADVAMFFNAGDGQFFVGESGTGLLFRLIRTAAVDTRGTLIGSTVEHAAIRSVLRHWGDQLGLSVISVDGIQHASHDHIDIDAAGIDGYVVAPDKVFSRHGYGIAWVSDRLTGLPLEQLVDAPRRNWELGTRDTGAYVSFSDAAAYSLAWTHRAP
jgi:selenocysteine lyase/cysteine desulfurase